MDKWIKGLSGQVTIDCIVTYEPKVKKPRSTKATHLVTTDSTITTSQQTVTLMLRQEVECDQKNSLESFSSGYGASRSPGSPSVGGSLTGPRLLPHAQSNPTLQGAWNMRVLTNAVPPVDVRDSRKSDKFQ